MKKRNNQKVWKDVMELLAVMAVTVITIIVVRSLVKNPAKQNDDNKNRMAIIDGSEDYVQTNVNSDGERAAFEQEESDRTKKFPVIYKNAYECADGNTLLTTENGNMYLINEEGEVLFEMRGDVALNNPEELVNSPIYLVEVEGRDGMYFVDRKGNVLSEEKYVCYYRDQNLYNRACREDGEWVYIDDKAFCIFADEWEKIESFCRVPDYDSENYHAWVMKNGKWGLIDEIGRYRLETIYEETLSPTGFVYKCADGSTVLTTKTGKLYLINEEGEILFEMRLDVAYNHPAELANSPLYLIEIEGREGMYFVDRKGNLLSEERYICYVKDPNLYNRARREDGEWVYVDDKGVCLFADGWEIIQGFLPDPASNNNAYHAWVKKNGKHGLIDENGKYKLEPIYEEAQGIQMFTTASVYVANIDGVLHYVDGLGYTVDPSFSGCGMDIMDDE